MRLYLTPKRAVIGSLVLFSSVMAVVVFFLSINLTGCPQQLINNSTHQTLHSSSCGLTVDVFIPNLWEVVASPDGRFAAYSTLEGENFSSIHIYDGETLKTWRVTKDDTASEWHPQWTADGELLIFQATRDGRWLWMVSDLSGTLKRFTVNSENVLESPDKRFVVVERYQQFQSDILLIEARSGKSYSLNLIARSVTLIGWWSETSFVILEHLPKNPSRARIITLAEMIDA